MSNILHPKNIIVKGNETPPWRMLQPRLGQWKTKHKDGKTISPSLSVKEQFSPNELSRIANAIHYTRAMGDPSIGDGKE